MHNCNFLVAAVMRVCVHHAGFAVGCPAGMPDAATALHGFAFIGHFAQHAQASLGLDHFNFAGGVLHSKAGRIIPAVFQLRKPIQQDRCSLCAAGKAYNSTHTFGPLG